MQKESLVIEANRSQNEYFKDLIRYRELFYFFAWRDILVRYKQALFGVSWALIRPLITMALFTFIFGKLAAFPSDGIPYPIFALSGMVPWMLFANSIQETTPCLLANPSLLSRIYFPRVIIPSSQIIVQFVDFLIALALLFVLIIWQGEISFWHFFCLPLFIALLMILCFGCSLILSALTVQYRDIRFIVPFFVQFGMYLSPVGYGSFMIPEKWQWLYFLNPMAGIIEGFRWSLFGVSQPYLITALSYSIVITAFLTFLGIKIFRKMERRFGDLI